MCAEMLHVLYTDHVLCNAFILWSKRQLSFIYQSFLSELIYFSFRFLAN